MWLFRGLKGMNMDDWGLEVNVATMGSFLKKKKNNQITKSTSREAMGSL